MILNNILENFGERVTVSTWFSFVGYIESVLDEIKLAKGQERYDDLTFIQNELANGYLLNNGKGLFSRLIAAELLSYFAIEHGPLDNYFQQLAFSDDEADLFVIDSLVNHLSAATDQQIVQDKEFGEPVYFLQDYRKIILHRFMDIFSRRTLRFRKEALQKLDYFATRTLPGLLPGDCVFRRQTTNWLGNPIRDFGHAGIYVGCINPAADVKNCENHMVIHAVKDKPACQLTHLSDFCNPDGKPEQFWGAYQIDITPSERKELVEKAYSLVNKGTYSFFGGYKNERRGETFRCDGFVEYCYESIRHSQSPLSYRGGLFEDDSWQTMNPMALRSCLTKKILSNIEPCCSSNVA